VKRLAVAALAAVASSGCIGCAPAFLVCTVFIARNFPGDRFAAVSGAILGIGSVGLLLTGTPLNATPRQLLGTFRHTVTTRKIEFTVYTADARGLRNRGEYEWIDVSEMSEVPHPSYVKKALRLAQVS